MAAPTAANDGGAAPTAGSSMAVDQLCLMFSGIERPKIQDILVNQCNNDATQAIVILTRIQQFNQSVNNAGASVAQTSRSGEAIPATATVTPSALPLSVQPVQPIQAAPVAANQGCCTGCNNCCPCCLTKPASYNNGLYPIDYKMYSIAFFIFAATTIYMELTLQCFEYTHYGLYCPAIGLVLIAMASLLMLCIKPGSEKDVGHQNRCGFFRGFMFIIGGLLYFLVYFK